MGGGEITQDPAGCFGGPRSEPPLPEDTRDYYSMRLSGSPPLACLQLREVYYHAMRPARAIGKSNHGPGSLLRRRYGILPFRATSVPDASWWSSRSSVMSRVSKPLTSGGALSQTLVSPLPTLVKEPPLMRLSPEANHSS
jgi:hypothetical protein